MSWTVLGSTGNIGRQLVARLKADGKTVFTPQRDSFDLYEQELGNVIYAIGLTADFRKFPYETVQAHVTALAELLQKGKFESLLYLSSTRVYLRGESGCEESPLKVLSLDPSDIYNLSKLLGESLCLQDSRRSVRVVRLSNVVGGECANSGNFVPSLVRDAIAGHIHLRTAIDSAKDYIHIQDVVNVLPLIAEFGRERLYNVASGVQVTHRQLIDKIVTHTNCTVDLTPDAPSFSFPPIDIERLTSEFNFRPRNILESIIDIYLRDKEC